ncbi:MAG: hypothetical protein LPH21_15940 [Shewanella sp.]|nr:hypothetical protein [Shewanella sp.]
MEPDTLEQQLIEDLNRADLSCSDRLLVRSLARVSALIEDGPPSRLPSLVAQQRQLIRSYNALKSSDVSFF